MYNLDRHAILFIMMFIFLLSCSSNNQKDSKDDVLSIEMLTHQINKDPYNDKLLFQRSQIYVDSSLFDLAIKDLENAIKLDSVNIPYYYLLSEAYLNYYNPPGALKTLYKAIEIKPNIPETLYKIAETKYTLKDYDGSILSLNEIIKLDPQFAMAYFLLGLNFLDLQDESRSINSLLTAVEMDSKLTDAWMLLGEIHEKNNDKKALTFYESAVLSNPTSAQANHAKAFYLQNHGKIPEAIKIYKEIITFENNYSDAYLNLGLLYIEVDSLKLALNSFDTLISKTPKNPKPYYFKGKIYEKLNQSEKAQELFNIATSLNTDKNEK